MVDSNPARAHHASLPSALESGTVKPAPMIVVSHRPPVIASGDGWERSPGGLVSALQPALESRSAHWLGHAQRPFTTTVGGVAVSGLLLKESERRNAIDGYCNRTLWPALHGIVGNIEQLADWWHAYQKRSVKTAQRVAELAGDDAAVWLHDYQMFGVAGPLSVLRPDVRIGLFCHTPIRSEALGLVTDIDSLARSLGACDHIGTQTSEDAHQLRALLESSGVTAPAITTAPVGIDRERWVSYRDDPVVVALAARYSRSPGVLAVGIDRIDYTKGLPHKLLAIELLLDSGVIEPEDFRLIQVAVPSRTEVPAYQFLSEQLREITDRINRQFARSDGLPVIEMHWTQLPPREVAGLMRAADLALITPVRDGLNLVALEFAVLNGDRPCEVILGAATGASELIGPWCSTVDGGDVLAVAAAVRLAISEAREQVAGQASWYRRSHRRSDAAAKRSSADWAEDVLTSLDRRERPHSAPEPALDLVPDDSQFLWVNDLPVTEILDRLAK